MHRLAETVYNDFYNVDMVTTIEQQLFFVLNYNESVYAEGIAFRHRKIVLKIIKKKSDKKTLISQFSGKISICKAVENISMKTQ